MNPNLTRSSRLLAIAVACFLHSQTVSAGLLDKITDSGPKRVELSDTSDKADAYKAAFVRSGPFNKAPDSIANGIKKLAIAGFQVEFATEQKAISRGAGLGAGLASTTDIIYSLKGVDDAQLQRITDKLYQSFVEQLQQKGYEVLPISALKETGYKEALQKANQPPVHHERGTAIDLVITPTEKEVNNASVIVTAKDTAPDVFARFTGGFGPGPAAADTLNANIIHLRLKIDFARFEESGWFNPEIDNKPQNMLGTGGTLMQVFMPGGLHVNFPLVNSIVLPHRVAEVANPVQASTEQTTQRAAGGAARALGGFLKGGIGGLADVAGGAVGAAHSVMASGNYEVVAGDNYETIVTQDAVLATSVMIQAFGNNK